MGNTNNLPVISQAKSGVQLLAGDKAGAIETQKNFFKGCPVVSQVVAILAFARGDTEYAKESQLYFVNGVSDMTDAVPLVGHVKGAIHYAFGNKEGGAKAMKAASRTTGVVGGGIAGSVAGPAGTVAGGVAGGAAMDVVISSADSFVHNEKRLYGHLRAVDQVVNSKMSAGEWFDWSMTVVFDGLTGYSAGRAAKNFLKSKAEYAQLKCELTEAIREGKLRLMSTESVDALVREVQNAAQVMKEAVQSGVKGLEGTKCTMIIDVEGNAYTGYSFRLRRALCLDPFQGEEASAQKVLNEKNPGGAPKVRGAASGEPSCAEQHALHEFHKAQENMYAVPNRMITIEFDGTQFRAAARCGNCKKIGRQISMGDVVTDEIDGTIVPLNDSMKQALVDALLVEILILCDCDAPVEVSVEEDKEK